ncbi:MAG: hydroxyectoine utilization dehydratase EutB [Rhodovibrionaceae bacterium]
MTGTSPTHAITAQAIFAARRRIAQHVVHTPLIPSLSLSQSYDADIRLKLDSLQPIGAFKLRGAMNRVLQLTDDERARGLVAVSTGNHGRAVAYAAKQQGVHAVVCMSELVPRNKLDAIERLGAEIRIVGRSQDEATLEADRLVAEEGRVYVPPFDDADVVAGQGTIGLELLEDFPEIDTALVPLSGGGLIAGIALALKSANPKIRIVGLSMAEGAAMHESLQAGKPVPVEEVASLADSLGGGIGLENRYTFALCRDLIDETLLLSEAEIAAGMRHLYFEEGVVAEGGAAVGVAGILAGKVGAAGSRCAVIVTGANIDRQTWLDVIQGKLPS